MADEYTPEQQAKIARHFVLVAPHGEVAEITADLRKVVSKSVVSDAWQKAAMGEHNKRRFVIAQGETSKVICCPQGEVEPDKYLNPDKQIICTVDPITQHITGEEPAGSLVATGAVEEYRQALTERLKDYLTSFYEDGASNPSATARGTGQVFASKDGKVAIVVSYKNLNIANYWTGGWQSEWSFAVTSKGRVPMEGRVRLNVHYYEDGNVQLNSTFNESGEVEVSDPVATAERVINTIATLETDFQKRLEKFYVQMHDSTFKNMRRFLPKIGKKMDWRGSVHALVVEAASK